MVKPLGVFSIVRSGNGADIWGLYARWHKMKGDLTMCSEALLKQVRSYQGSDLWKDRDRFKKFAQSSLELCKVYMEISASTGSRRELLTAEMHLKNTIKQAVSFSDMEELQDLKACLHQVKERDWGWEELEEEGVGCGNGGRGGLWMNFRIYPHF
ncbi:unnamed protein product [Prunus armeniaca]|uniref:Uncharacterized protein n=1 Tax=Prunus armeniaca TaxID=36596 RepID=A0A6J5TZN6_PRUAR|nr:unnamed protein product [Prunus armeniaca]